MTGERALASRPAAAPVVQPTVAEAVAEAVAAAGAKVAFTFPGGGSNLPLLDALGRLGVRVVLAHSEGAAAFMAATTADLTGVPGVLVTGVGPGVASSVNGVAHAFLDRSPLLVVTDRFSPAEAASSGHQLLDGRALLAPLVKHHVELAPEGARDAVDRALAVALAHPQGPVHLELRRDVVDRPAAAGSRSPAPPRPAGRVSPEFAAAVASSRYPVLLVGHEARLGVDQGTVVRLAERLRAPVLTTYKAKGVFPETHRLAGGIVTGAAIERALLDRADLFLGIGFDPVELLPRPWAGSARLLALRRSPAEDPYLAPALSAAGEIGPLLEELSAALGGSLSRWTGDEAGRAREAALDALRVGDGLTSWRVIEIAAEELGEDRTVAVDAGAHMFAATCFWRSGSAGGFLVSNGLASMGYAVPAAVAASLADPARGVVAFSGDGGFLLGAAELETAVRHRARVLVIVLNDASLSLIRIKQDELGLRREAVDYARSDFAQLARSLGAAGFGAADEPALRQALRAADAQPLPAVVDVSITGDEYGAMHRVIRG